MNLNELTLDNIGSWPMAVRISVISFICFICFILFYIFDVKSMRLKLAQAVVGENDLRSSYQVKYSQTINQHMYLQQIDTLQNNLKIILTELPNQLDTPELIGDISNIGIQSRLHFNYLKPKAEIQHSYYVALPIEISVNGTYAELNNFITALAKIPFIITIDDFSIQHAALSVTAATSLLQQPNSLLTMELTAVIYKQNMKPKTTSLRGIQ